MRAIFHKKKPEQRDKTLKNVEGLRLLQSNTATHLPVPAP